MNFKKIIATVAAAAVAVSAMAVSAFAIKDYPDGYTLDLIAEGYNVTDVYGFTLKISGDIDSGVGGGVGFNSASTGWESHEWGNADAGKELNGSDGVLTIMKDAPVFQESDVTDPTNPYAQIWMQQWWGSDVTIDGIDVLGADGVVLTATVVEVADETEATDVADDEAEATDAVAEDETADEVDDVAVDVEDDADEVTVDDAEEVSADDTAAVDTAETTTAVATGNVAAASIVAVMAVAGVAAVATKKRK